MSRANFVFPPPPPPPPSTSASTSALDYADTFRERQRGRGRGNGHGRGSGRGRGANMTPIGQDNRRNGQNHNWHHTSQGRDNSYASTIACAQFSNATQSISSNPYQPSNGPRQHSHISYSASTNHSAGQKRDFGKAFARDVKSNNRMGVAPAVPSFGGALPAILLPPANRRDIAVKVRPEKKGNLLGLTPNSVDYTSSSEEDVNEEQELAAGLSDSANNNLLQFTYRGKQASLNTPTDVAAWIEERKKRFPTKTRIQEAEERKAQSKAHSIAKNVERKRDNRSRDEKQSQGHKSRKTRQPSIDAKISETKADERDSLTAQERGVVSRVDTGQGSETTKARLRIQKLQEELMQARQEIAALEARNDTNDLRANGPLESSNMHIAKVDLLPEVNEESNGFDDIDEISSDLSETESEVSEEGTSSAASTEESDEAPQELTSKQETGGQQLVEKPKFKPAQKLVCRDFKKDGRCKWGRRCRYLHERPESASGNKRRGNETGQSQRLSLYQRLLARQQEEEDKMVLDSIVHIGDQGLLDEPSEAKTKHGSTKAV